ncbi:GAF domain-containing protein [Pseudarthrobacter sp. MDT3-1]
MLTDARGEVLWRVGSPEVLRRADGLEFSEGADWSEAGIGTNAISEALVTGRPVQLFSAEHLIRTHHERACTAAPITDPLTGKLLACSTSPDRRTPSGRTRCGWCGAWSGWRRRFWERPTAGLPRVPLLPFVRPGSQSGGQRLRWNRWSFLGTNLPLCLPMGAGWR